MGLIKEIVNEQFLQGAPLSSTMQSNMDRVFSTSGLRETFENLWKQTGNKTDDLWNQRRFWEGRDLVGRAEKPGMETGANQPEQDIQTAAPGPREELQQIFAGMSPEGQTFTERKLNDMFARNGDSFTLEQFADKPEQFMRPEQRTVPMTPVSITAGITMAAAGAVMGPFGYARKNPETLDKTEPHIHKPGADTLAFAALVTTEAGHRIHHYHDDRDNRSTLAGNDRDDEDDESRLQKQFLNQMALEIMTNSLNDAVSQNYYNAMVNDIENGITSLETRLEELQKLYRESGIKIEDLTKQQNSAEQDVIQAQFEVDIAQEYVRLKEETHLEGILDLALDQETILENHKGETYLGQDGKNYQLDASGRLISYDPETKQSSLTTLDQIVNLTKEEKTNLQRDINTLSGRVDTAIETSNSVVSAQDDLSTAQTNLTIKQQIYDTISMELEKAIAEHKQYGTEIELTQEELADYKNYQTWLQSDETKARMENGTLTQQEMLEHMPADIRARELAKNPELAKEWERMQSISPTQDATLVTDNTATQTGEPRPTGTSAASADFETGLKASLSSTFASNAIPGQNPAPDAPAPQQPLYRPPQQQMSMATLG